MVSFGSTVETCKFTESFAGTSLAVDVDGVGFDIAREYVRRAGLATTEVTDPPTKLRPSGFGWSAIQTTLNVFRFQPRAPIGTCLMVFKVMGPLADLAATVLRRWMIGPAVLRNIVFSRPILRTIFAFESTAMFSRLAD